MSQLHQRRECSDKQLLVWGSVDELVAENQSGCFPTATWQNSAHLAYAVDQSNL